MLALIKKCVQFSPAVLFFLAACNNSSDNEKSNVDTTSIRKRDLTTNTITGSAGNIYINDGGEGGIPVVFVHSFGGSTQHWEKQLSHVRTGRRAIALDLRGHGQSAAPADGDYNVVSLAGDIAAVVDSLHLQRFVLVGHSMGGSAAIDYAGKYPDRVAGLVVTGTPGKMPPEQSKQIIASLESAQYDTVMEAYMKKILAGAQPATEQLEREGMKKLSKETNIRIIKAEFFYDPEPALSRYTGPVLIISRPGDEQGQSLHKLFPKTPYKTIEGTSHWMQLDKPDEFNKLLDDFLRTIEK